VLLDREHLVAELFGITNVPTVVWIDQHDRIARPAVIAPGDDMFRSFSGIDSAVHHEQLRAWVHDGTTPFDASTVRERQQAPSEQEQLARLHRRVGAHLARNGDATGAERHFEIAGELAPMDWTIRRGTLPLRGADPFGDPFFEFAAEWDAAGRPGYGSADQGG
jgi:hypothetical protein